MPNINFNAPVIRLGTGTVGSGDRKDVLSTASGGGRPGMGLERGSGDQGRERNREASQSISPLTNDEKLRTMVIHQLPEGVGGDDGVKKLCSAIGRLRKWEPSTGLMVSHKSKFGFAIFDDLDSLWIAVKLFHEEGVDVPVKRQPGGNTSPPEGEISEDIEKTSLKVSFDEATMGYIQSLEGGKTDDLDARNQLENSRQALKQAIRQLFYPPSTKQSNKDGDTAMANNESQGNVEVVNISIAQEDELADIPAEMREVVAKEIAAFRERSNQRDIERLKREEEIEERERHRNGASGPTRSVATTAASANNVPLGPRASAVLHAPSGPKGQNSTRGLLFINGGNPNQEFTNYDETEDVDGDDEDIYRRKLKVREEEDEKLFIDMERKWLNRERSRQSALDREQGRERQESEHMQRRKEEQVSRDKAWDDDLEAARKSHPYYRDYSTWSRNRAADRVDEELRDDADRRAENDERRREQAQLERARGMADSFLDQQDLDSDLRPVASAPAPQPFKLSLGAAAQRAQASRAMPQRRTIAEVEGLLDDEDAEPTVRRPLIPIQMDASATAGGMSEEEISQAVRALAQEIPSDKDGLWSWDVKWDYMDESIVRDRLRPFVEKKIVEYLGVQEEMLVETVEDHLRKHGQPGALVQELEEVSPLTVYHTNNLELFADSYARLSMMRLRTWSKNCGEWQFSSQSARSAACRRR